MRCAGFGCAGFALEWNDCLEFAIILMGKGLMIKASLR